MTAAPVDPTEAVELCAGARPAPLEGPTTPCAGLVVWPFAFEVLPYHCDIAASESWSCPFAGGAVAKPAFQVKLGLVEGRPCVCEACAPTGGAG